MDATAFAFADDGDIPNHPRYPLIVYRGALAGGGDMASAFEDLFAGHGWGQSWRNGIFAFHHYHSTAHEVLGIAAGAAEVRFGGPRGEALSVAAGDAVLIPAGVGHCRLSSDGGLLVIGAYPAGSSVDLLREGEGDPAAIRRRVAAVARPAGDPVAGPGGPMDVHWPAAG